MRKICSGGITFLLFLTLIGCAKENIPPAPSFIVFPSVGDTKTLFYFDARKSSDNSTIQEGLSIRWDWESDSVWDTPFSQEKEYVHRFEGSGFIVVTMQARDFAGNTAVYRDTVEIWSEPETGQLLDTRDGQVYHTVKFQNQWVMSENIRYGTWIRDSMNPTPTRGPEYYLYGDNPDNLKYGGLYTFYEAMNYRAVEKGQGICPDGWHVPSFKEWSTLLGYSDHIEIIGYNPINIQYYFGPNSSSGMNLEFLGYGNLTGGTNLFKLTSYGRGQYLFLWTSDPVTRGFWNYYAATALVLSESWYRGIPDLSEFDPFSGDYQTIGLYYVRCIKNN